jgi:DNA-binding response OmpR family regulator
MSVRIMVIDNTESLRQLFGFVLADEGWQVFSYEYFQADLAAVQQLNPDLIILDFDRSQGGVGWVFLQLLRMDDTTAAIPVLVCTAMLNLSPEIEGYLAARSINVVHKPFNFKRLIAIVQQALSQASQAEELISGDVLLPILVVDDNQSLREAMASILRMEGYQVVTASNGMLALDAVTHAKYCLILLDIDMPVMNGLEFLTAYNQQPGPHTPVIIVSAQGLEVTKIVPSFVIDMISKPFQVSHLLMRVNQYIQPI